VQVLDAARAVVQTRAAHGTDEDRTPLLNKLRSTAAAQGFPSRERTAKWTPCADPGAHAARGFTTAISEGVPVNDENNDKAAAAPYPVSAAASSARREAPSSPPSRLNDAMAFLRGFLANPFEVASIAPSSVYLEARIVQAAKLEQARCVVELGPGTGGTTRALLRAMAAQSRLLAIELNPGFCDRLRRVIDDPRLALQAGSAESLADALRRRHLPAADVVVTGIPFSTLPVDVAQRIAAAIHANLAPGGRVVAYQCRPHVATYLKPHFGEPRAAWEWRSLTPMRVFVWTKPLEPAAAGARPSPAP
jgi:phospholipid N-methyltransferase